MVEEFVDAKIKKSAAREIKSARLGMGRRDLAAANHGDARYLLAAPAVCLPSIIFAFFHAFIIQHRCLLVSPVPRSVV